VTAVRLKLALAVCLGLAGFLGGATLGRVHDSAAAPQQALCSSGYVTGVIGGQSKCLRNGEFCSSQYESDYERYGFTCTGGRLQGYGGGQTPTTTTSAGTTAPPPTVTSTTNVPTVYQPPERTKTSFCHVRGSFPDPGCTPGAAFVSATTTDVCRAGYSSSVRNVPSSEKRAVYAEYGIRTHRSGQYEVDHLISLELGGSNDISNLWPEAAAPWPGFHQKDVVENYLHAQVCSGAMTLAAAQRIIATNWVDEYAKIHG
jgi:hypothetical protein